MPLRAPAVSESTKQRRWQVELIGSGHILSDVSKRTIVVVGLAAAAFAVTAVAFSRGECSAEIAIEGRHFETIETSEGLGVLATSDEGFYVGALFWILRIGDVEIDRSTYPGLTINELEFQIPEDARRHFTDGDPVSIRYGNPVSSGNAGYVLGAGANGSGGEVAVLRIADGC